MELGVKILLPHESFVIHVTNRVLSEVPCPQDELGRCRVMRYTRVVRGQDYGRYRGIMDILLGLGR